MFDYRKVTKEEFEAAYRIARAMPTFTDYNGRQARCLFALAASFVGQKWVVDQYSLQGSRGRGCRSRRIRDRSRS